MPAPVSIKDIARLAHVSHSTVSRALRDSALVNPQTRELIHELANRHGYRPSLVGRSLVTRQTMTIGCAVTSISDPFAGPVVNGIEDIANQHGYSVLLANSSADPARELQAVRSFQERRVDGVLVAVSRVGALYAPQLAELQIPIVLINNQSAGEYLYSVAIENVTESRRLVHHLISLGHKRVGYIGDKLGFHSDVERLAGYRSALEEAGIEFDPGYVVHGDSHPEGGLTAMNKLLEVSPRPTAVFCYNDLTALGAYGALAAKGLSIPDDISIVGFDDLFFSRYLRPALTTIRQPMLEMGRLAMSMLLDLLSGKSADRNLKVYGELMVRGSSAPPGGELQ
jgi:DNA-binding LacI/PurR family transcriptional regulator